jgi:hypothetical protein
LNHDRIETATKYSDRLLGLGLAPPANAGVRSERGAVHPALISAKGGVRNRPNIQELMMTSFHALMSVRPSGLPNG